MKQPVIEVPKQDDVSQAILKARQEMRDNGGTPKPIVINTSTAQPATPPPAEPPVPPAAAMTPPTPTTPPTPPAPAPAPPQIQGFDEVKWLTEKSGGKYNSWDALWADATKAPVVEKVVEKVTEPIKFANETSEQIAKLLSAGKIEETLPFIQTHALAKQIATMTPDVQVKSHMKAMYGLTDTEVEREFAKNYVPDDTLTDPIDIDIAKKKATAKLNNDAQIAVQYFSKKAEEVKLPFNQPAAPAPKLSPAQEQAYDNSNDFITAKNSSIPFEFDEPQKALKVKGTYTPPADRVAAIKAKISADPQAFLAGLIRRWQTSDEQIDPDRLATDLDYLINQSAIAAEIAHDAMEQTFKQRLQQEKQPGSTGPTGGPWLNPADAVKEEVYRGMRIPIGRNPLVTSAPQG